MSSNISSDFKVQRQANGYDADLRDAAKKKIPRLGFIRPIPATSHDAMKQVPKALRRSREFEAQFL